MRELEAEWGVQGGQSVATRTGKVTREYGEGPTMTRPAHVDLLRNEGAAANPADLVPTSAPPALVVSLETAPAADPPMLMVKASGASVENSAQSDAPPSC